jgi:regulator of sirC expression with transglutaminase-like and TPR domain
MSGNPTDGPVSTRAPRRTRPAIRPEPQGAGLPRYALEARGRLRDQVSTGEPFDVVEAALLVAAEEYPDLDIEKQSRRLDILGGEAARRLAGLTNPFARVDMLRAFLFEDLGFRGNADNYDDPKNSYLNEVLDRRLGIPLTLSLVYMEVGLRAGLDVRGIALPGHFIVRVDDRDRTILVDPFHGGEVITEEDCRELVVRTTGRASLYRRDILAGATQRQMLGRILLNLKRIHLSQGDYPRALAAVERLLIVFPHDARELRDRGLLLAHMGCPGAAVADLEEYLARAPEAPDADSVRGRLAWLLKKVGEAS